MLICPPGARHDQLTADLIAAGRTLSDHHDRTTNQAMEVAALCAALEALQDQDAIIYSDSRYALEGAKAWIHNWARNGWITTNRQPVKNAHLWKRVHALVTARRAAGVTTQLLWVKGHSGHPGNSHVDALAQAATARAAQGLSAGAPAPEPAPAPGSTPATQPAPDGFVIHIAVSTKPGNPRWGALITGPGIDPANPQIISAWMPHTTAPRLEVSALAAALDRVATGPATLYAASDYIVRGATEWLPTWASRGWTTGRDGTGKPLANGDLWRAVHSLLAARTASGLPTRFLAPPAESGPQLLRLKRALRQSPPGNPA